MGYRIRIAPEVEQWLAELRESDPGAAQAEQANAGPDKSHIGGV